MSSILKVDTIQDQSGNNIINENADTITIGASGDTITIPSGATLDASGATLTLPTTIEVDTIEPQSGTSLTLGASGDTITIPSGATITNSGTATGFGGTNTPAFSVYKSANFDISDNVETKIPFDTESYDTDSAFASEKFTVPSGEDGKYFFYSRARFQKSGVSQYRITIVKNGVDVASRYLYSGNVTNGIFSNAEYFTYDVSCTLALSVGDYVEVFIKSDSTDGGDTTVNGGIDNNEFTGFKIIE